MRLKMLVVGGDRRSGWLVLRARTAGFQADGVWLDLFDPAFACAWPEVMDYDFYILPYPVAEKEGMVATPLATQPLLMAQTWDRIPKGANVLAGKCEAQGAWRLFSPASLESFAVGNAVPSAEGAIFEAMRESESCVAGSHCLVVGYGRIGRLLSRKLCALGAEVTVAARKEKDRVFARAEGCAACDTKDIAACIGRMQFIFNTAPAPVISETELTAMDQKALALELASAPYGIDMQTAARLGRRFVLAGGIPGKYAPAYAADVLLEAIRTFIAQEG